MNSGVGAGVAPAGTAGRADLLHAYAERGEAGLVAVAGLLGFEGLDQPSSQEEGEEELAPASASASTQGVEAEAEPFAPIPFWRLEEIAHLEPQPDPPRQAAAPALDLTGLGRTPGTLPQPPPLVSDARLWPVLRSRLASAVPSREVDVEELAAVWSRGRLPRRIPFRPLAAWAPRLSVLVDRSVRLIPFWHDQDRLLHLLRRRLGRAAVHELRFNEGYERPWRDARRRYRAPPVVPGTPALALGDLGFLGTGGEKVMWRSIGQRQQRLGGRCFGLVTCPSNRWNPAVGRLWEAVEWERPRRVRISGLAAEETQLRARAERVLVLLSFAARIEPGLLRTVRRLLPATATDAGTEADIWAHPDVISGFSSMAAVSPASRKRLQARFAAQEEAVQRGVVAAMRAWRAGLPREIWLDETLALSVTANLPEGALSQAEIGEAKQLWQRMAETVTGESQAPPGVMFAVKGFVRRALDGRQPEAVWADPSLRPALWQAWKAAWEGEGEPPLPAGVGPEVWGGGEQTVRRWEARQIGDSLSFAPAGPTPGSDTPLAGSPVAELASANGRLGVFEPRARFAPTLRLGEGVGPPLPTAAGLILRTDRTVARFRRAVRPSWASAMGRDQFGLWASFTVEGVDQVLRWIPPGRFFMGSPEDEPGRWPDEGPRHLKTIGSGFWLAETPCTQALWEAVMGDNPSHFQSPQRPVEKVSWEDCQGFLAALNQGVDGLEARLPTEAEWEYACRAGTETATYAGPIEILGQRDAPALDAIAWYGGNSGKDFDLEQGVDSSDWKEKQEPHTRAGTRPTRLKAPNPWGLYDMLGNVNEWCDDVWGTGYSSPRKGSQRVIRGGSWVTPARLVRAAFRDHFAPSSRWSLLGFRLARGQGGLPAGAELKGAERPRGRTRDAPASPPEEAIRK